jgi:transmembrane sensor
MNRRREPIGELLQEGASEEELQRIWRGIQRSRTHKPARWAPLLVPLVLAGFVLAAIASWWPFQRMDGALRDQTGRGLGLIESSAPHTTTLSDGSRFELGADSTLEVLANDDRTFVCALRRGRATFDVTPGGPRRWRIEAGAVAVEVVGTRFRVDRRELSVVIEVERGTVLVRGEDVRDGVQKLQSGARLEVPTPPLAKVAAPQASPALAPSSSTATPAGDSDSAPSSGTSALPPSTDWLLVADGQRRRGDVKGAVQTLRLAVERAPDDKRRATAAFTLGKLLLDAMGKPVEAQAAFRTCLERSPPAAIAEDALARLVEAQSRSGAREAALATAREYEKRYPNGRRLSDVRRWTNIR